MTEEQWEVIKGFFHREIKVNIPEGHLVEAVLNIVKTCCQWRTLPHDYKLHGTVLSFYRWARGNGTWDKMMKHFIEVTRKNVGRNKDSSYAPINSQRVKTMCYGKNHGYNREKTKEKEIS